MQVLGMFGITQGLEVDMNVDIFARQMEALNLRLNKLYQGANASPSPPIEHLLPVAFKELGIVSEELQVAVEELCQQNQELAVVQVQLQAERQRYQDLFQLAPEAYLVTDINGKIREANRAAALLLNISDEHLIGKPLVVFVASEERWQFRNELNRKRAGDRIPDWKVNLQPRGGEPFEAMLTVSVVRDGEGRPTSLRWMLRQIGTRELIPIPHQTNNDAKSLDSAIQVYAKGEIIPLNPQSIWQVHRGLVKLTTICETGEEVLVGLVGDKMLFGASLTALKTYQATAMSKQVQLVEFSLAEIASDPHLAQTFFEQINRRLKQTELLLAIFAKRRVQDRLQHLLLLLQQEIGEFHSEGTRLKVRLTHEDFANACSTTRVTMTRLLLRLQQEGKIAFDCDRHLILKYGCF
jgi:PAS domain S-box-containing protein